MFFRTHFKIHSNHQYTRNIINYSKLCYLGRGFKIIPIIHFLTDSSLRLIKHHAIILFTIMGLETISCTHFKNIFYDKNISSQQIDTKKSLLGKVLPDLSLFPMNSTRFRLSELKNIKAIVISMRDTSCPISQEYGHLIAKIEQEYAQKGIKFIYSYVGQKNPKENAEKDLKKFKFKEPYVIDTRQKIINTLGASATGEVFVLTPERKLIYKGPLDSGYQPSLRSSDHKVKNHYVVDVLQAVVSGKKIALKELESPGKLISRPILKKQVYFKDVAPIIKEKCTSCHNPEGTGLMNFISYEDIAGRGAMFKYVIEKDLMPPWYVDPNTGPFRDDTSLTLKEKALLLQWANQGFPARKRGRKTLLWSKSKRIKSLKDEADYVISLPEKVIIPAEGAPFYKRFVIQTPFKEDKWIKDVRFVLKPKVVHHFNILIMESSYKASFHNYYQYAINLLNILDKRNTTIHRLKYYKNIGDRLPSYSKLMLEIHYETIGQKTIDNYSQVYINFHKQKPKYETITIINENRTMINIPPHTSNYKIKMSYKIKEQLLLSEIYTHMHFRGKASSVFIIAPKDSKKRIFGIDPFVRAFERSYIFKKPIVVSKETIIKCINWFDNSANNRNNPDPKKHVTYGLFIENEMSMCILKFLVPVDTYSKYLFYQITH